MILYILFIDFVVVIVFYITHCIRYSVHVKYPSNSIAAVPDTHKIQTTSDYSLIKSSRFVYILI